ncbi:hypothetical protein F9C11_27015 [Amycolatopsis sp. VS8301801F10]|uniref:hypothetical protein n=1 Tax=Amycolatopsis sp. VS8301801F10 TaxID=2652442 RepID=UPI0038FC854D
MGSAEENRRPGLVLAVVVFLFGWLLAAAVNYHKLFLSFVLPVSIPGLVEGAWLIAAAATAISAWLVWRRLRWPGLAGCAAVAAVCAVLMATTDWVHFYATTWYSMHRSDFADALTYLDHLEKGMGPPEGISRMNNDPERPVWFVRVWSGIPDCASGFAHFTEYPEKYLPGRPVDSDDYLDGAGCAVRPTVELGDGWWWVE